MPSEFKVNPKQFLAWHDDSANLVEEASTLQLPPGGWPQTIRVTNDGFFSELFTYSHDVWDGSGEDLVAKVYKSRRRELHVLND